MRNQPKPLDRNDARRAYNLRDALSSIDAPVTLEYVKRDGSVSSSTGTVGFFSGADGMDTMSVTLDTADKGPRTINLCRVISARKVNLS